MPNLQNMPKSAVDDGCFVVLVSSCGLARKGVMKLFEQADVRQRLFDADPLGGIKPFTVSEFFACLGGVFGYTDSGDFDFYYLPGFEPCAFEKALADYAVSGGDDSE